MTPAQIKKVVREIRAKKMEVIHSRQSCFMNLEILANSVILKHTIQEKPESHISIEAFCAYRSILYTAHDSLLSSSSSANMLADGGNTFSFRLQSITVLSVNIHKHNMSVLNK